MFQNVFVFSQQKANGRKALKKGKQTLQQNQCKNTSTSVLKHVYVLRSLLTFQQSSYFFASIVFISLKDTHFIEFFLYETVFLSVFFNVFYTFLLVLKPNLNPIISTYKQNLQDVKSEIFSTSNFEKNIKNALCHVSCLTDFERTILRQPMLKILFNTTVD